MKIEIEVPAGKRAEWVNGVLTLVDDKPKDVKERIKTFEDARKKLGNDYPLVDEYETITCRCGGLSSDILAYMKLRIICAALNEGWEPKFTKYEQRYYPWFNLYTKEEIEDMDEEKKQNIFILPSTTDYGGVAYAIASYGSSSTYSNSGSRLAFKNKGLAEYAGRQFIDIWVDCILSNLIQHK